MADAATLLALADRCEREDPTFELECAIAEATGWYRPHPDLRRPKIETPKFCSSLDAAVTLTDWCIVDVSDIGADGLPLVRLFDGDREVVGIRTGKPVSIISQLALAFCAAALRALAAKGE